jgi:hypothetical protein
MRSPARVIDAHLLAADASSPADVWVVGAAEPLKQSTTGLALRWDGDRWRHMSIQGADDLYDVAVIGPDDVWAFGPGGFDERGDSLPDWLGHWDGRRWSRATAPPDWELVSPGALAAVATDDVWLVGTDFGSDDTVAAPYIAHWDGVRWSHSEVGVRSGLLLDVSAFSSDSVWATGYASLDEFDQASGSVVLKWDGNEWLQVATPDDFDGPDNVTATGSDEAWVVPDYFSGEPAPLWRWDGHAWTREQSPLFDISAMDALDGVLWAAGSDPNSVGISRLDDGEWEPASMTDSESLDVSDPFPGLAAASETTAWGVGREPVASRACSGSN